jgi:K+-sensing histidine kinase KdpD
MVRLLSSSRQLPVASVREPNLRLVSGNRAPDFASTRALEESAKTAVMACLSSRSSDNSELLRKAAAAARDGGGEFYAVMADSPSTRFGRVLVRRLIDNAILASELGAKIVRLESSDTVGELLKFARQSHVGRIFVLRSRPAPVHRLFGRTVYSGLLRRAEGIRVDVVGFEHGH